MRPSPRLPTVVAPFPPPLSPASIAPLAAAPIAPAISWLSEHPLPARRAGKTLLPDAFKLSSRAVPYLLSFGWGRNTSQQEVVLVRKIGRNCQKLIGMRHRLVHAYFDSNLDIMCKTVLEGIPPLFYTLWAILGKKGGLL